MKQAKFTEEDIAEQYGASSRPMAAFSGFW
jgi:hypothetical protein